MLKRLSVNSILGVAQLQTPCPALPSIAVSPRIRLLRAPGAGRFRTGFGRRVNFQTISKKIWIVCVSLFASILLGQRGFSQEENPMLTRGRVLFERHCATCHGQDAKGDGPMAEVLKVPPSDLTQIQQKHGGTFPQARVRQFIDGERPVPAHGSRDMPIWGKEFRRNSPTTTVRLQIAALAAFIESIQE